MNEFTVAMTMSSLPLIGRGREQDPLLVIVPSVPIAKDGDKYVIDEKTVSGLSLYLKLWPGTVRCIFRKGDRSSLPFGKSYNTAELPFEIQILSANAAVPVVATIWASDETPLAVSTIAQTNWDHGAAPIQRPMLTEEGGMVAG